MLDTSEDAFSCRSETWGTFETRLSPDNLTPSYNDMMFVYLDFVGLLTVLI